MVAFSLFAVIIDLIRRGLLKEKYSILWLASASIVMALTVWGGLLNKIAALLGIEYPPSFLFLVALLFILLILLHYSVVISTLTERNKTLAQEIALLRASFGEIGGKKGEN
jgi:hypothetical protein